MECEGLIVYRMTMAFVQSPRPILVMSAECICGLLIYILVILIVVVICHPTEALHCHTVRRRWKMQIDNSQSERVRALQITTTLLDIRLQVEVKDQNMDKHPLGIYHRKYTT